jgi:phosphatidylglycerophosphate synthase
MVHARENSSVLAAVEKRLLIRIARKLPPVINSDHLTDLALLSMFGAGLCFALIPRSGWFAAAFVGLLVINWFGDSLDGTVARVRDRQRPRYGFYVDHTIDLAGTAALVAGMALSGMMSPAIGFALLAAYFMVAAESFLATHSVGVFRMSFAGFGPTELRIVLAAGAVKVASSPTGRTGGPSLPAARRRRRRGRCRSRHRVRRICRQKWRGALSGRAAAGDRQRSAGIRALRLNRRPERDSVDTQRRVVMVRRFVVVGASGFVVQLTIFAVLSRLGVVARGDGGGGQKARS